MRLLTLLSLITLLAASPAVAQIDIEMAFDPAEVAPGDVVIFSGSLISSFDEDIDAEFEFYASYNDFDIGPFTLTLPVCERQNLQFEIPIRVPQGMCPGELEITITVSALGSTDTATANLTITGDEQTDPTLALMGFAGDVMFSFACGEVPIEMGSVGALKSVW